MTKRSGICIAMFLSMGCADVVGGARFRITTNRDDDSVEVKAAKDKAVISIRSPSGISQAIIESRDGKWPRSVVVHMHLKGLENFKLTNGKVALESSVSSDGDQHSTRLWLDGKEVPAPDTTSPYWMKIRIVGNGGNKATVIPLVDGHFEMQVPAALLKGNAKSMTISWIDFYR